MIVVCAGLGVDEAAAGHKVLMTFVLEVVNTEVGLFTNLIRVLSTPARHKHYPNV